MQNYQRKGWVRLHRCLEDNGLWFSEPFTRAQAWIDLFLYANHKDGTVLIRGNVVTIKRGQIGWSELTMCKRWKWSRNKVRRFLKQLEAEQQIVQQKDRYITTIITILNYERFQNDTANETAERQQKVQQKVHKQELKNDKNVKNNNSEQSSQANKIIDVFYKTVNPTINYGNMTNRKAADDLIKKYGLQETIRLTEYAVSVQGKKFAPTITTPYQLKEKMGSLKIYHDRSKSSGVAII